jgi:DNA-binding NarL/FixJ family response regulator
MSANQTLTKKQAEVRDLLVRGWSNKEIATQLQITARTVEAHRAKVYEKMGVRNAVELVRKMLGATV